MDVTVKLTEDDLMSATWYPIVNDLIGGWAVVNVEKLQVSDLDRKAGEVEIASFISERIARHIADLHNSRD